MKPDVFILMGTKFDKVRWAEEHRRGLHWDATPYGYGLAAEEFQIAWSEPVDLPNFLLGFAAIVRRMTGLEIVHALGNLKRIVQAQVVWTHTEREYLPVLALMCLVPKKFRPKVVGQSVWLWDHWHHYSPVKRFILRRLLATLAFEIVLSRDNHRIAANAQITRPVRMLPFGTSAGDGHQNEEKVLRPLVLGVGNDRDRAWEVLISAAKLLPDVDFFIAADPAGFGFPLIEIPDNLTVARTLDLNELESLYSRAHAVAIPLRKNAHASGITVAIEAMGRGIPLIVSDTGGLSDYLPQEDVHLIGPEDREGFTSAVVAVTSGAKRRSASLRQHVTDFGLRQEDYVERICMVTRHVLGHSLDEAVSIFAPMSRR